ncbi:MAG: AraC family transcriptional regulator [Polyangiaceae bacterium]
MSSPLSLQKVSSIPPAPESHSQIAPKTLGTGHESMMGDSGARGLEPCDASSDVDLAQYEGAGRSQILPGTMQRLIIARARIYEAARAGQRIRTYEVALDLDMSEFHFARQFRLAFDRSPHVYYDEVRADTARLMLNSGHNEGYVARKIGFRRPAELRALLGKRPAGTLPPELSR